ncbi:MAG TPA: hypothetical protein VE754_02375, partial [Actinomycetota bacterium]|nr:hypothetical protein [Actinomycetota bacterium]
ILPIRASARRDICYPPGDLAQRKHSQSRFSWWLVAVPIALAAAAVILFALRDEKAPTKAQPKPSPEPAFEFTDVESSFVSVGVKLKKVKLDVREESAAGVAAVVSAFYDGGFVAQGKWGDGTFPSVMEQFEERAVAKAADDLTELTLGPESARLSKVTPGDSSLEVSVLFSGQKRPVAAVARADFEGEGVLKDGGTLLIAHEGVYFLRLVEKAWKIVAWQVDGNLDTDAGLAEPTPTETPS